MEMANIVLAHGVLGQSSVANVEYFHGVRAHLEKKFGARVLSTDTPPVGTVESRANALAEQIVKTFGRREPVHVIAHSMGGLDTRMLISKNMQSLRPRIKTLICIGTPHRGSPVASLLDNAVLRVCGAHAVHDLSERGARAIDEACPDVASVRYVHIAGVGRKNMLKPASLFFLPTFLIMAKNGKNDGMVPFASATRGRKPDGIWHADHGDLIGHDLDDPLAAPSPVRLRAYADLVKRFIA